MSETEAIPPFPVDDATLLTVEHALDGALTYERPDGAADGEGPWLVGADYSLSTLLDFLAGCTGRDPHEELIQAARDESDLPEWERGRDWSAAQIVYDDRLVRDALPADDGADCCRERTTAGGCGCGRSGEGETS